MKLYFNTDPIVYDQDYQLTMIEKAATWFWFCAFFPALWGKQFFLRSIPSVCVRSSYIHLWIIG